jgi:uncharacterized membrane protein
MYLLLFPALLVVLIAVIWLVVRLLANARDLQYLEKSLVNLRDAERRLEQQVAELRNLLPVPAQRPEPPSPPIAAPIPPRRPVQPPIIIPATPPLRGPEPPLREERAATPPVSPLKAPPVLGVVPAREKPGFDWEALVGVKLFSWIAGVALLLGAIFFLRYSIDRGWLMPPVRMAIGIVVGILLLVLCEMKAAQKYRITANAVDASAIAILFSTFYAAHALWHLIGGAAAFAFLGLVTIVAVLLSIRRDSLFIALLGLIGGFATPALLSTGENRPFSLFGYLLLLNAGLAWVASRKKWPLLTILALILTALYQWSWVAMFLTVSQLAIAVGIFLAFPILAISSLALVRREEAEGRWHSLFGKTAEVSALLPLLFAIYMASVSGYGSHYMILFGFLFVIDAGLLAIAAAGGHEILHVVGGIFTLLVFANWLGVSYESQAWPAVLGIIAFFVLFYLAAPLISRRFGRSFAGPGRAAVFAAPPLMCALAVLAAIEPRCAVPPWLLLGVLFVLYLAVGVAALHTRRHELLASAMAASALILIVWVVVARIDPWPGVGIISAGGLALLGFVWIYLAKRLSINTAPFAITAAATVILAQIVALVAVQQPGSPSFGFLLVSNLIFLIALLGIGWFRNMHLLAVIALIPATITVSLWIGSHAGPEYAPQQLLFAGLIYLVFLAYPLFLGRRVGKSLSPYLAAVLAGVPFFFQARHVIMATGRGDVIGILPVAQAALMAVLLGRLLRIEPPGARVVGRLVLVAGAALAFVTVAIPLQFEKQWITIGWALEGAAVAWLFRRIPHKGFLYAAAGLLIAAFVRLALNPFVLVYEPRGTVRIWNWCLYTYLISAAALILAGWLFAKTSDTLVLGLPRASTLFPAGGVVLLFLLLNFEIADFYSVGNAITFNFSATLAQDLTYTLGWALFAVALLACGISISSQLARISALALLVATVLKCFLHDLASLGGLYRVMSFVGLALCLALVALALQRFVLAGRKETK